MGHLLHSVDDLQIHHTSIPDGLAGSTPGHTPHSLHTKSLAGALFAALTGAALATLSLGDGSK